VLSVVVRTAYPPGTIVNPVKAALARIAPEQPVSGIRTMEEVIGASVSPRRFLAGLLGGFALLALALAAVGIAGVVGYSVVQRTPEIGIRMALGAGRRDVLRLVIGHSLSWALAGVVAGIAGAVVFLRLLESVLYEVRPADPGVLATVSVVLLAVALGATWLPARRATRVDPVTALRAEG
ncbi:MAG TPA: FtsX-like permease family protein, partial [Vicinamibacterales bacterium]